MILSIKSRKPVPTSVLADLHRVYWMLARERQPLAASQIAAARRWDNKYALEVLAAGLREGEMLEMLPDGRYTLRRSGQAC